MTKLEVNGDMIEVDNEIKMHQVWLRYCSMQSLHGACGWGTAPLLRFAHK